MPDPPSNANNPTASGGKACQDRGNNEQANHWIVFKLLDGSGNPVKNVSFKVELPDKSIKSVTTNAAGIVRIDGIKPPGGSCSIFTEWQGVNMKDDEVLLFEKTEIVKK
jgi:hypothetical protein